MPRSTNFLLTAAARTLKIKDIFKMGEEKAWEQFVAIRFADNCAFRNIRPAIPLTSGRSFQSIRPLLGRGC